MGYATAGLGGIGQGGFARLTPRSAGTIPRISEQRPHLLVLERALLRGGL